MEFVEKFIVFLANQKNKPSPVTTKNYKADIQQFVRWCEQRFNQLFTPILLTPQVIEIYKKEKTNSQDALSKRSLDRHLSSLRKFCSFLQSEGLLLESPFILEEIKKPTDPWNLKGFKNHLYVYNSSSLTIKNYIMDIFQFIKWLEKTNEAKEAVTPQKYLTSNILEAYKKRLMTSGFSPLSVNRKLSSLRRYCKWAKEEKIVTQNVSTNIPTITKIPPDSFFTKKQPEDLKPTETESHATYAINYSLFPPLRLLQKTKQALLWVFDLSAAKPIALFLEQLEFDIWKMQGGKIFQPGKQGFNLPQKPRLDIRNVEKVLYAPVAQITKTPIHKRLIHQLSQNITYGIKNSRVGRQIIIINVLLFFIASSALGFVLYQSYVQEQQKKTASVAAAVAPPRLLSFQGRLTDASDNPITDEKSISFRIYNDLEASGAAMLWEETNNITPDTQGVFSILLGNKTPIAQSLFAQNAALYVGIAIGDGSELIPRQQLATVPYASNTDTLQGLSPITQTNAGVKNVVLALDSSGDLLIGNSASPTFQATGGQFKLSGQPLILATNAGSNGDIQFIPDGTGKIDFQKPIYNSSNYSSSDGIPGAVEVNDTLVVLASETNRSAFVINQNSTGPIISASTSGTAKFSVANDGTGYFAGNVGIGTSNPGSKLQVGGNITPTGNNEHDIGSSTLYWKNAYITTLNSPATGTAGYLQRGAGAIAPTTITDDLLVGAAATTSALIKFTGTSGNNSFINTGNLGIGTTNPTQKLDITGNIKVSGTTTFNGVTYTWPSSDGSNTYTLQTNGSGTLSWIDLSTSPSNFWRQQNGTLYSANNTVDFVLGGIASSSAKFAVLNIDSGTPTATLSAGDAGGIYMTADGKLATTTFQNLTLGDTTTTANVVINPAGNIGIATTNPTNFKLEITGNIGPSMGSAYDIGSSARRWATIYADTGNFTNIAGTVTSGSTSASDWLINSDNATNDTEDATLSFERGTPAVNSQFKWNATTKQITTNTPSFVISGDSGIAYSGTAALIINQIQNQDIFSASASGITRLVLNNNGNLGIGTTSPLAALDVQGTSATSPTASISANSNFAGLVVDNRGSGDLFTASSSGLNRLVITQAGNVGIGTTAPDATLNLEGSGAGERLHFRQFSSDVIPSNVRFQKARNTQGSPTIVASADMVGHIAFAGYDGANYLTAAAIRADVDATPGTNDMPGRLLFYTTADGASATSERMRINSSGFVGIGSTNPASYLTIDTGTGAGNGDLAMYGHQNTAFPEARFGMFASRGTASTPLTLVSGDRQSLISFNGYDGSTYKVNSSIETLIDGTVATNSVPSKMIFTTTKVGETARLTRMTIGNDGYVGIGAHTPTSLLDIRTNDNTGISVTNASDLPGQRALFAGSRARGTITAPTQVADADTIFSYLGFPYIDGAYRASVDVSAYVDGTPSSTSYPTGFNWSTTAQGATTRREVMRLNNAGILMMGHTAALGRLGQLFEITTTANFGGMALNTFSTTANQGAIFDFNRSKSATKGTHTIVAADDALGHMVFRGSDGSSFRDAAYIKAEVDGTPGASDMPGRMSFWTTRDGSASSTERVRINNAGNVGIGTTSPIGLLHISGIAAGNAATIINQAGSVGDIFTASASGTPKFVINNNGNVGIGPTLPNFKLDISDSQAATVAAMITNSNTGTDADGLAIKLGFTGSGTSGSSGNRFLTFLNGNGNIQGTIESNGSNGIAFTTSGIDFAEYFKKENASETFAPGDLVCVGINGGVTKCSNEQNNGKILGIISDKAGFVGGGNRADDPLYVLVGMVGQLEVKVTAENGAIKPGDPITASSLSGIAGKATKAGYVVGHALTPVRNTPSDTRDTSISGTVLVTIQPTWYDPDVFLTSTGNLSIQPLFRNNESRIMNQELLSDITFILKNAAGDAINKVGAFANIIAANIKTGLLEAHVVTTDSLTVTGNQITIAGKTLNDYIISVVTKAGFTSPQSQLISPLASINKLQANIISPLSSDAVTVKGKLVIASTSQALSGIATSSATPRNDVVFEIQNASGSAVATIDNSGNASFSGQLTALGFESENATIAGTLRADNIIANNIEGLDDRIATIASQYVQENNELGVLNQATQSASASFDISDHSSSFISNLSSPVDVASYSAQIAYVDTLSATFGSFSQGLMSFGPTSLSDVSVTGQLSIDSQLILASSSINVLGKDLEIQPLKQGGISFLSGLIRIDTDGNLTALGNASFAKDVTVKGKLTTNLISPLPNEDLIIQLPGHSGLSRIDSGVANAPQNDEGNKFIIQNASNSAILTVDQQGNLSASGSANFTDLLAQTFRIVRGAQADTSFTETVASSSAGTATIITGETERTIINPFVTEQSLIYLTPTSDTQGITPYVARQTAENKETNTKGSFTIQIPQRQYEDIKVNWWIIN